MGNLCDTQLLAQSLADDSPNEIAEKVGDMGLDILDEILEIIAMGLEGAADETPTAAAVYKMAELFAAAKGPPPTPPAPPSAPGVCQPSDRAKTLTAPSGTFHAGDYKILGDGFTQTKLDEYVCPTGALFYQDGQSVFCDPVTACLGVGATQESLCKTQATAVLCKWTPDAL